jgi:hypothetical protein
VHGFDFYTLIEHWDGTSWAIVDSPNVDGYSVLADVNCVSTSDCWAVGTGTNSSGYLQTLIEHWDGVSWSVVPSDNSSATENDELFGVACSSTSDCWAVGDHDTADFLSLTLIEHWNGNSWNIVASPDSSGVNGLRGVACVSESDCWAVGYSPGAPGSAIIIHWDGTSWSIPGSSSIPIRYLYSVACAASDCWAVGTIGNPEQTVTLHSDNGEWVTVSSPNVAGPAESHLEGIACPSPSDCWAAGYYRNTSVSGIPLQTLIEHWDGTSWSIVSSPNPSTTENYLYSVTCPSGSDCWAVGYGGGTLIEHWDGNTWTIVPSPNYPGLSNVLLSVTCPSASDCWAVGNSGPNTLIEHWDGTSWSIVPSPNGNLYSVTCTSVSDCWAVGTSVGRTLIEHWNGITWLIMPSPNVGNAANGVGNTLNEVTCASASDCWAVGYYTEFGYYTLAEHWDGSAWTIVLSDDPSGTVNLFEGVTCASAAECWAVGRYYGGNRDGSEQTLIERWNGTSWAKVTSADTGRFSYLKAVTCASESDCWTVGLLDRVTLTQHYGPPVQLVGVKSRKAHGNAGTFDIDLPLTGNAGIECRSGSDNQHRLIFTFAAPIVNCGVSKNGIASGGPNPNQCTVELTGVANAEYTTVNLNGVVDNSGNIGDVSVTMGVLLGDVNGSGRVDAADVSLVRQQTLQAITVSNFREDINASGRIDAADVSIARQQTLTSLP